MSPKKMKTTSSASPVLERDSLEMLFKNHPIPMWIYDLETLAFLDVNDAAVKKYGYTRREFLTLTIKDIRPAEDVPRLIKNIKKERSPLQNSGEWRHQLKDGQIIDVEITSHVFDLDGRKSALVMAQDVTERSRMEKSLRESESRYRDLVENSHDLICTHDLEGNLLSVNDAAVKLTGYPRKALLKMNLKDALTSGDQRDFEVYLKKVQAKGRARGRMHIQTAKGETRIWDYDNTLRAEGMEEPIVRGMARDITEQEQAKNALHASERRFRALIENGLDNISLLAVDGTLLWESPAVTSTLGYAPEQFVGHNIFELVHPDDLEWTRELYAQVLQQTGKSRRGTFRLRDHKGKWRWVEAIATNMLNERDIEAIVINYRDITARKQAEDALHRSEELFKNAFRHSAIGMALVSTEGKWLKVNSRICSLLGYTEKELLTKTFQHLTHPDDLETDLNYVGQMLAGEIEMYTMEKRYIHKKGGIIWAMLAVALVKDNNHAPLYFIAQIKDFTERKQAEEKLQRSEERYKSISEDMPAMVCRFKADGTLTFINSFYCDYFGKPHNEILGSNLFSFIPEPEQELVRDKYLSLNRAKPFITYEYKTTKPNGGKCWQRWTDRALFNEQGEIVEYQSIGEDITERRQAEEERNRLIRDLGERVKELTFLHNVARVFMDYSRPEDEVMQDIVKTMPSAWQYPEVTRVRIDFEEQQFATEGFRETPWMQSQLFESPDGRHGVIQVAYLEERPQEDEGPFLNEERNLLVSLAEKLQTYLRGISSDRAVSRQLSELETLYESGLAISRLLTPEDVARAVIGILERRMDWHHIAIRQYEPESNSVKLIGFNRPGISVEEADHLIAKMNQIISNPSQGLSGWATMHGRPIRVPNVKADERYVDTFPGLRSGLYVPLKVGERVIGSIAVESEVENSFSEHDERLLETLAGQAAIAIENANLFNKLQTELIERRLIEEQVRQLNSQLEERVRERTLQIETTKRRLELAAHAGQIGVWEYHPRENKVIWDDRMHMIHHLPAGAFGGTSEAWAQLIHPDDLEKSGVNRQLAVTKNVLLGNEHRIILPNGSVRHITTSAITVFSDDGKPERVVGISMDVTERKQIEETLKLANAEMEDVLRIKDEFLANMSHELRTPLNSILGISESLEEQIVGALNEKQLKYVGIVKESGRHLLELINDILDISKIEAGRMELDFRAFSVEKLCQSSLRMVKELAQKKSLNVSFMVKGNVRIISGDERRLKQSLVNLLSNAVKFTGEGGQIGLEVEGHPQRNEVMLTVWDEGIGIAQEDLKYLFKPFVQLDAGLTREYQGTGLGLTLVAQMVRLHGGHIRMESELGKGSRFIITLPWRLEEQNAEAKATGKLSLPRRRSKEARTSRILLVEDTDIIISLMKEYLIHQGYQVLIARNGREGVLLAKRERPDLILMDVMMPVMDGLEATKMIRAEDELKNIPIVALTALAMPGDRERCLAAGMNDYLSKPVRMDELSQIIERYLDPGGQADAK
jgi:PAS domain S-box-containing protein